MGEKKKKVIQEKLIMVFLGDAEITYNNNFQVKKWTFNHPDLGVWAWEQKGFNHTPFIRRIGEIDIYLDTELNKVFHMVYAPSIVEGIKKSWAYFRDIKKTI